MSSSDSISFSRGAPSLDIIDVEGLKAAADRTISSDPAGVFSYGTSVGYVPLRNWLADQYQVEQNQVMVTNGSMQADAFLFDLLVKDGDVVITENPTYDRTLLSLTKRGADVRMIDIEQDGINLDQLEGLLTSGIKPKLAHIIPNYQNPAGVTLSLAKRKRLLELANEHDFVIFEDDPYREVRFQGEPLPTMFSLDQNDRVVYVSSFTKTVCPGVRVGYAVGPEKLISDLLALATGTYISPCMFSQATVYQFCAAGALAGAIKRVQTALSERCEVLAEELMKQLPEVTFIKPEGGYFMWLDFPVGTDIDRLAKAANDQGVVVVKGTDFTTSGGENSLRLAYSAVGSEQIVEGVKRLAKAYQSLGN